MSPKEPNEGEVNLVNKDDGRQFRDKRGRHVFHKEGVHFALSKAQMRQMRSLINDILGDEAESDGH